jgi:hypothetical protein
MPMAGGSRLDDADVDLALAGRRPMPYDVRQHT